VDIIITPTCFHDTPTYEEYLKTEGVFDEKDFFTVCANISGVPAISMPAGISDNGLPIGVQFIANVKNDELLLNVANWFSKNNSSNFNYLKIDL
jgi:aspartyl-tRNA(Asn)/glutamyl-tRNA(Gln) amidotransferase subunit A